MNSKIFFLLLIGVTSVAIFGLSDVQITTETLTQNESNTQATISPKYQSQSARMGAVDVEITPISLDSGTEAVFDISLNTHSVELDYDFTSIISLKDDQGNTYPATGWSGGIGGHHLSGSISFDAIDARSNSVTLVISGIDQSTKDFSWVLL